MNFFHLHVTFPFLSPNRLLSTMSTNFTNYFIIIFVIVIVIVLSLPLNLFRSSVCVRGIKMVGELLYLNLGQQPNLAVDCRTAAPSSFRIHTSGPAPPPKDAETAKQKRRLLWSWRRFLKYYRRARALHRCVLTNATTNADHMGLWQSTVSLFTDVWVMSTESLTENTKYSTTLTQKVRHWKWWYHCHKIFTQRTQHHVTSALKRFVFQPSPRPPP